MDAQREPVPIGVAGEIYIGGAGVARGYLNRPELTAERFIPDPFSAEPSARLYRTGDLGRYRADGNIEFLGRNDFQVKVRGYRIELGEIESQLLGYGGISEAVVLAREDAPGEKRLVAYVVRASESGDALISAEPLSAEVLRSHLSSRLPEYMVPSAFVVLEQLPLTPNGKLDRQALPAPEGDAYASRGYEAPQGEVERSVAAIWVELLKVERVGRQDHFFELGGHSLLAVQLISRLREQRGVEVALAQLFAQPVLAEFARAMAGAELSLLPDLKPADRSGSLPLSFAQQRLWFLAQLDERAGAAYHIPGGVRLRGVLDRAALEGALARIVERHEALRTVFEQVDGEAVQVIGPAHGSLHLIEQDLSQVAASEREAALAELAGAEASAPFDLQTGPLIRARLIGLSAEEHVLLVTMHHIVSDGWSMGVLIDEFSRLYTAFSQGEADPLPALAVQYADYALWQRQWLSGAVLQGQLEYWREHLEGAPTVLELPTDHARPAVQDFRGASVGFHLDEELTRGLKALSQRQGTTLFMTLLASWAVLLGRLSNQDDIVIGTPNANRSRREIEGLIGLFVNTQALRIRLKGAGEAHDATEANDTGDTSDTSDTSAAPAARWLRVEELLQQVKQSAIGAQRHQDLPFEQVVEALHPERSLSHSPVFQVMFAWQNAPEGTLSLPGLELDALGGGSDTAKFDLDVSLQEVGPQIVGALTYATALFEGATIERYLQHWKVLLRAMVADASQEVDCLPLLSSGERQQLLIEWNATQRAYPQGCIHELFEEQVERTPDAVAVVHEQQQLTYGQLNERANRLAHYLRSVGVQPGECVATALERSLELVIAELAILKCGAAYVPLDPVLPPERQAYMVKDCQARYVLSLPGGTAVSGALSIVVDDPAVCSLPGSNLGLALKSAEAAYVMYTSGSTGAPKGVVVAHGAVVNLVCNQYAQFSASDRMGFAANPAFDSTTLEVWAPLLHGGTVVVIPQAILLEPDALAELLHRHQVNGLILVAGLLQAYAQTISRSFPRLRYLLTGGDKADVQSIARILQHNPPEHLIQTYGPTEATQFVTAWDVTGVPAGATSIPIGRPIANTRIYLLDEQREPVPIGVSGEIYIGGAGVARGYLNRPELTAERFIPDPFSAEPSARLYRTGDLGRYRADGNIEFLGRNDFQVKVRGYRIELGEIESQLLGYGGIGEAVVVAREDAPGEKRLVAYVVRASESGDAPIAAEVLRGHLAGRLPEYMVPSAFVVLEQLPLTPNGKLDRQALPAPEGEAYASRGYEAPQGEVERSVAAIWVELLKVERVGRQDHFFELGGHSLLAVQLISRLREQRGVEVALAQLFAQPVLAEFARAMAGAELSVLPDLKPADRSGPLPLSFAQQRLWFLAQLDERAGAAYHIPGGVRLRGVLDRAALEGALARIVERHEALRTVFEQVDGEAVQVIGPAHGSLHLIEQDLSQVAASEREAALAELAGAEASAPFDLQTGPLIRARLIGLSAEEHVLLVTMHHIVSDGWSMGVLIDEFSRLYTAFSQGEADPLPALAVQYADYALWQRQWLSGAVLQGQLEYWMGHLEGAPTVLELPTDHARPAVQDFRGASVGFHLDEELTRGLKALSQRQGTTLFMTLLASWAVLLGRLSNQDDIVIGTPNANRSRREIEGLIGLFVNTQALRIRLKGAGEAHDATEANDTGDTSDTSDTSAAPAARWLRVEELLRQVKQSAIGAQRHQDLPFEQVVEALNPERSLSHSPVFQVMFAWQNAPEGTLSLPGLELGAMGSVSDTAKFDLDVSLQEAGPQIVGALTYATALFEGATIERYLQHWQVLLRAMVADASVRVDCLPLLSESERQQLLIEWNATQRAYRQGCIHELFEEQVARTPDAVAVVHEDQQLTYGQLNARANRLAHYLRSLGVQPDERVAICVQRSLEMLVGLLGILKAGGAYVPLDPEYPAERLAYMLKDSAPVALLTHRGLTAQWNVPAGMAVIDLDSANCWAGHSERNLEVAGLGLTSHHLAYVIYTSGSTGLPKGVMVEHRGLVNYLAWASHHYAPQGGSIVSSSLAFDATVTSLYVPLLRGASVTLLREQEEIEGFAALLGEGRSWGLVKITPAHWKVLGEQLQAKGHACEVEAFVIGGEELPAGTVQLWRELQPQVRLINEYGPTETVVGCVVYEIPPTAEAEGSIPIGRPIANTQVYLLDAQREPVPIGVVGEIYIGGAGVARGYLNRPELTAERFIHDPFSAEPSARLYRTGDLGRYRADGNIEFLGRNDFQVKVRGYRIELGEIESQLLGYGGISEAVVVAREDAPGEKRLVAYVVRASESGDAPIAAEVLRGHLAGRLPEYMVPSAFVVLEQLPLTPNGKLDRKALPAPEGEAYASRGYEAPQGEVERSVAAIWVELLKVERVGRQDHFFELGGHSLLAIQLVNRLRQADMGISIAALFTYPTLAALAQHIVQKRFADPDISVIPLRTGGTQRPLFLVHEVSGEVLYGPPLTRHVDDDIPVYGLPATWPMEAPLRTLDAMAARTIHAMRSIQPQGPYRLAGWSFGGTLAYEMALQLIGADETVEFLGLFDAGYQPLKAEYQRAEAEIESTAAPAEPSAPLDDRAYLLQILAEDHEARRVGSDAPVEVFPITSIAEEVDFASVVQKCQEAGLIPHQLSVDQVRRYVARWRVHESAGQRYSAQTIPIPIHLFAAQGDSHPEALRGWDQLLPESQIRLIPVMGTHASMMTAPYVEPLGKILSRAIKESCSIAIPEADYQPLITIQTSQRKRAPLFCVPGAGANVMGLTDLAMALGRDWPVYGLQPRGLDGLQVPHATVQAAAEAYVKAIDKVYPAGQLHLLGHSFGGWIAFEMAQRLRSAGRSISSLTILDSEAPDSDGTIACDYDQTEVFMKLVEIFELSASRSLALRAKDFGPLDEAGRLALLHQRLVDVKMMPHRSRAEDLKGMARTFAMHLRTNYCPAAGYPDEVGLILVPEAGQDELTCTVAHQAIVEKWKAWIPHLNYWRGPGNHMSVLKQPYVDGFANWLREKLRS